MTDKKSPANWRPLQRVKNNFIYAVIKSLLAVVRHLPVAVIHPLGSCLGYLGFIFDLPDRRKALANLKIAFGNELSPKNRRKICRRAFIHLGRSAAEMVTLNKRLAQDKELVIIGEQERQIWREANADHGVIAMTGHFGNWEILAQTVTMLGGEIFTVAKQLYDPRITDLIEEMRGSNGLKIIWRQKHQSIRPQMVELLQKKAIIGILNDQRLKVPSQMVPFFGHEAKTATGAATLAYQTDANIVGLALLRQSDGRYKMIVENIPRPMATDEDEFVSQVNLAANNFYERIIRQAPEQWVWLHNRWK